MSTPVCVFLSCLYTRPLICRFFFIDKEGEEMTEQERQRLNQRAQRFAGVDGNRSFKKKLSVAELVQAAVSFCNVQRMCGERE